MGRRRCCCEPPAPVCTRTWTVRGCQNYPLPDAVVTMTSSGGIVSSGTTDANGQVTIAHGAASGSWTASHPSGRFFANSGTFTGCNGSTTQTINLFAASGYTCCNVFGSGVQNPYPIAATFTVTDSGGTFTAPNSSCNFSACVLRADADNYADSCEMVADRQCLDPNTGQLVQLYKPPAISTGSIYVRYTTAAPGGVWQLTQGYYWCTNSCYWDGESCPPSLDGNARYNKTRYWRVPGNCSGTGLGGALLRSHASTGFTVNSLLPLNVTFHFAAGNGFGPFPTLPGGGVCTGDPIPQGNPYSMDVTITA